MGLCHHCSERDRAERQNSGDIKKKKVSLSESKNNVHRSVNSSLPELIIPMTGTEDYECLKLQYPSITSRRITYVKSRLCLGIRMLIDGLLFKIKTVLKSAALPHVRLDRLFVSSSGNIYSQTNLF